ncbi:sodium-dependent phosphate transport protein 2B-like [Lineus longissimus]|uniref:sodium-dependent phosphate transport protein 2B-like n=1 Tax=Lineus longissimus TaxID=88925 RepID=UPI002B4F46EA
MDAGNSALAEEQKDKEAGIENVAIEISDDDTDPNSGSATNAPPNYEDVANENVMVGVVKKPEPEPEPEIDPWSTDFMMKQNQTPWKELDTCGKWKRVVWHYTMLPLILIGALYLFICSLDFLSSAFKLLGGRAAGIAFRDNQLLQNPVAGLMVGILATVLVQSSSTSTSIVITMVAAEIMYPRTAIPIVMGANIGTSVTNTIVSMGQIADKNEFRRAFGGATVHDMFNWLSVLVLLPLEVASGYLYRLSGATVAAMDLEDYTLGKRDLLKTITSPFTKLVVSVSSGGIKNIAAGKDEAIEKSFIKIWCKYKEIWKMQNKTFTNVTENGGVNVTSNYTLAVNTTIKVGAQKCRFMFMNVAGVWKDEWIGALLLVIALVILCSCLIIIVKILNALLRGSIAKALKRFINADFPGKAGFLAGYLAILIGAGLTILVQSSSIFTSAMTPLVGVGVLSLERMYPLTLGANIGTTATGVLAALTASTTINDALQVALSHLFFNISGILIWYPIPFLRNVPINLAKFLGNETAKYRWFALLYLVIMFFALPGAVFGLSLAGWKVALGVLLPIVVAIIIILIIKLIQKKRPSALPLKMRDWKCLPEALRSLRPLDRILRKICPCCVLNRCQKPKLTEEGISVPPVRLGNQNDAFVHTDTQSTTL